MQGQINKNVIPIIFAVNNNYSMPLNVAITSILKNASSNDFYKIYILYKNKSLNCLNRSILKFRTALEKTCQCDINFIDISDVNFDNFPHTDDCKHISKETYFRYIIPSLFKNYNKVLYLDCDITVKTSLKELYDTDITDYYFAGVEDILEKDNLTRLGLNKYCNAGVMLLNLEKMRKDNIEEKLFNYTVNNQDKIVWQDQDVMNVVMQNGILYLPLVWNTQVFDWDRSSKFCEVLNSAKIIHYVGCIKPWDIEAKSSLKKIFYEYYNITPICSRILSVTRYSILGFVRGVYKIFKYFRKKFICYDRKTKNIILCSRFSFKLGK